MARLLWFAPAPAAPAPTSAVREHVPVAKRSGDVVADQVSGIREQALVLQAEFTRQDKVLDQLDQRVARGTDALRAAADKAGRMA